MNPTVVFVSSALALAGCGDTGQIEVSYPITAVGTASEPFAAGAWQVTLQEATIGFGPIYFCATTAASSDLCPAAVSELADYAAFDGLDPAPQTLGTIEGVSGVINSATWDYAITWFPTQQTPVASAIAPGGHSARFTGTATRESTTLYFEADVDVVPRYQGTLAVQGTRVSADISDSDVRLEVHFDPAAWWRDVDFDELVPLADDAGHVAVPATSRAINAIVIGMTASAPPTFEWVPL